MWAVLNAHTIHIAERHRTRTGRKRPQEFLGTRRVCDSLATLRRSAMQQGYGTPEVLPGDPRTLGYGTDQGRWLQEAINKGTTGAPNPFRYVIACARAYTHEDAP